MLTARKVPRACQSCRSHLLSLFEHGFTRPISTTSFSQYRNARYRSVQPRHSSLRPFSTTIPRPEENLQTTPAAAESAAEIEAVVRRAKETFGETLPKDYLSAEEFKLYERLYGAPLRETTADDLEYIQIEEENIGSDGPTRNVLLRETSTGEFEEVEFDPELGFEVLKDVKDELLAASEAERIDSANVVGSESNTVPDENSDSELEYEADEVATGSETPVIQTQAKNQREIDAIEQLLKDVDETRARMAEQEETVFDEDYEEESSEESEEEFEEDDYGDDTYISSDEVRTHPHTMTARFGTSPRTLFLPKEEFTAPISELLERSSMKHLTEAAEKAFGGKGLPHSSSTPNSKGVIPQKHIGLDAAQHRMSEVEADAYLAGVMPGTYAIVMSALVEVRKRLGSNWVRDILFREGGEGVRVLDAGAGGAGIVAWKEILRAEWDVLKDEGIVEGDDPPSGKTTVLTGPDTLRHRVSRFLDNTTFLPRLPDYVHSAHGERQLDGGPAQPRKSYDLIIAPHTLFPLKEDYRRRHMVQNLWSLLDPKGGVLILIEKGIPRGFEAIAGARALLLDSHISSPNETTVENEIQDPASDSLRFAEKEEGMIIAPCTNHTKCPMYPVPGLSTGRKDYCHFEQRYIRPAYLQKILGQTARNHEDVKYSYVAVRRGIDARKENGILQGDIATDQSFEGYEEHDLPDSEENQNADGPKFDALSLPRTVLPPLKRRGHVTLDLCTPSGKLERWTVPKSFSRAAYRDARKSRWGDLWALGAKTRVVRQPRLGRKGQDGVIIDGKKSKSARKNKKNKLTIVMGQNGMEGIEESKARKKIFKAEKRTKGGRVFREKKPIGEDDL
ncbi:37S ribosomal Rsm22 protein [Rutstroemia sp. NJR-2017a BVV2]|nr:37S ribosomal Rsm22 protein [Rutstroemia sp. NJR-2017a BVV2]